ncbi:hypothetical protein A6V39_05390 [Candidatus Mycoplasma haematobovis]|uniref:Uncharacterized protein n=1 Tax=Candidatus Mycoplasma haematobovis TaxID=432608 RepID=A0A1A9QDK0_9MOLU|nr:hypothetical protein [Candidatus Mycoplasma haematobovis]OAL09769.1 hypothetical protein A6V39_05390 [Candidatus Mycoplasma haematobovis]
MDNIAKSLIGLAITGITAVGGYYGWQNSNFADLSTQKGWGKANSEWFNTKYNDFKKKADKDSNESLWREWLKLQQKFSEGKGLSDYQLGQKLKEWCSSKNPAPAVGSDFLKVKSECDNL